MRSGNPALSQNVFLKEKNRAGAFSDTMTVAGTVNRTAILLLLTFMSAAFAWGYFQQSGHSLAPAYLFGAVIVAFIISLVIIFKKTTAPYLSPVYCLVEGAVLGFISLFMEAQYPGIVTQAILATFGVALAVLLAYKLKLIRATKGFKLGIFVATAGIAFVYIVSMIARVFGYNVPVIHEATPLGIAFSLFVVGIAALNLILDFDFIESGERQGAPKYMEWYGAFGVMITLVWLYLEILRLLAKTKKR